MALDLSKPFWDSLKRSLNTKEKLTRWRQMDVLKFRNLSKPWITQDGFENLKSRVVCREYSLLFLRRDGKPETRKLNVNATSSLP